MANSFATFLILCPTSFFLGMLFQQFPYDFPVLWTSVAPTEAYYDMLENHLRFVHSAPALIPRVLHIVISVGLLGFLVKLYKPSEANMLFDGASLVLYMSGVIVYAANIVKGLRVVTDGTYGETVNPVSGDEEIIGRVDSLRVLSASNTILALLLIGVLVLQSGQWYAERKEKEEAAQMDRRQQEERRSGSSSGAVGGTRSSSGSKKRQ